MIHTTLRRFRTETAQIGSESAADKTDSGSAPCVSIRRTPFGKPVLVGSPLFVGVTHTDTLAVIALSDVSFGIDCENGGRIVKRSERIAHRFFSDAERALLDACESAPERQRLFLDIWVKKEAYVKYLGTGFRDLAKVDTCAADIHGHFEKIPHGDDILYVYTPV